jgi:hypothetical protein
MTSKKSNILTETKPRKEIPVLKDPKMIMDYQNKALYTEHIHLKIQKTFNFKVIQSIKKNNNVLGIILKK